jgi:hypothetical protein
LTTYIYIYIYTYIDCMYTLYIHALYIRCIYLVYTSYIHYIHAYIEIKHLNDNHCLVCFCIRACIRSSHSNGGAIWQEIDTDSIILDSRFICGNFDASLLFLPARNDCGMCIDVNYSSHKGSKVIKNKIKHTKLPPTHTHTFVNMTSVGVLIE